VRRNLQEYGGVIVNKNDEALVLKEANVVLEGRYAGCGRRFVHEYSSYHIKEMIMEGGADYARQANMYELDMLEKQTYVLSQHICSCHHRGY